MEEMPFEQIKKLAKENNYEEVVLNFKKEKPLIIEGIKGFFIPEVLFYKKGENKSNSIPHRRLRKN